MTVTVKVHDGFFKVRDGVAVKSPTTLQEIRLQYHGAELRNFWDKHVSLPPGSTIVNLLTLHMMVKPCHDGSSERKFMRKLQRTISAVSPF